MIELIEVIVLQAALSSVIHVPRDAPTPQAAVDQAQPGDTVLLARGIHRGPVDLQGKAITLRGAHVEHTVLLGDADSSVICCLSGEGWDTVIEDLTIAGGGGTMQDGIRVGGGLCMAHASPTVRRCLVVSNAAQAGSAAWIDHGQPVFEDCWFHGNAVTGAGAITCEQADPRLIRCGFHGEGIGWWDGPTISIRSDCDAPGGACCLGPWCVQTTDLACAEAGGVWHADAACGSGVCAPSCPEDVNNDRRVNMTDVLLVIERWGMCM